MPQCGIGTSCIVSGWENGAKVAGIVTSAFAGSASTVTLSETASDVDFVSFFLYFCFVLQYKFYIYRYFSFVLNCCIYQLSFYYCFFGSCYLVNFVLDFFLFSNLGKYHQAVCQILYYLLSLISCTNFLR